MEVDRCTGCGKQLPRAVRWNRASGGAVCTDCGSDGENVPAGIVEFIRKSRKGSLEGIRNLKLWQGGYRQCLELMREFAETHLDMKLKLKSLGVLEDLENDH